MKTNAMMRYRSKCRNLPNWAMTAVLLMLAPASRAGVTGPYAVDGNTLHLWHLQETSGTTCFDSVSNQNAQTFNFDMTNAPGPNASIEFAGIYPTTNFTYFGQPGPDSADGYAYAITTAKYSCLYEPYQYFPPTNWNPYPFNVACTNIANFVNTNTGAWTMETLIQPQVNLATYSALANQYLIDGDGPGNLSLPTRAWQWRIDYNSGKPELEFNDVSCPGTNHQLFAFLPTTGPDAIASAPPWPWYHVALAWTGGQPTNSDSPHLLTVYWTLVDPARTNGVADVLTNFPLAFTYTNKVGTGMVINAPNTLSTGLYPSNSLHGTPMLLIGGLGRGTVTNGIAGAGGFLGSIAEARLSMSYRHTNEFMFNPTVVPEPPTILSVATNTVVSYLGTLKVQLIETGSQPITNQWYQIINGVTNLLAGQTNLQLVVSNVTFAANGYYQLTAANAYGTTNSVLAQITINPAVEGAFNTGCDTNNNPLDATAPGSVDQHWQLLLDPDPAGIVPNAIVWNDGNPVVPIGLAPVNGASVWIGPRQNAGTTGGTYTYQTTFQVDECVASPSTVISANLLLANGDSTSPMHVFLNGVQTNINLPANPTTTTTSINLTNGLQSGSNTLTFTLNYVTGNGYDGAVGFRCQLFPATGVALTNAPVITNAPASVTNIYGSTVSFSAVALGAPQLFSWWLSNSVPITPPVWVGTTLPYLSLVATNFNAAQLTGTNYYANYQAVFSNAAGVVTSAVATLDVQLPPLTVTLAGIPIWNPTNSQTNIVVFFSAAVDPTTAATAANYSLDSGAGVLSATVTAPNEVVLTTTVLAPGTTYNLTVQNVKDSTFGITMAPSPSSIMVGTYPANVALWVRANTGVTTDANGVNQWNDLSGNGNNLSQSSASFEPQLVTNAYGDLAIRFNATNITYMSTPSAPSLALTSNMTIVAVVNFATLAGNTNGMIVSKTGDNLGGNFNQPAPYDYYSWASGVRFLRGNGNSGGAAVVTSTTTPAVGVPHILDVTMTGTNVTHRLDGRFNGGGLMSINSVDTGNPLYIGTRADGANHLTGDLSELIVIGSALTTNDLVSLEKHISAGHTIFNSSPTNIVVSESGGQVTLSWPLDHIGWQLQSNSIGLTATGAWFTVSGSTSTNAMVVSPDVTQTNIFYRMFYQAQ